jgi:hypothetical protein
MSLAGGESTTMLERMERSDLTRTSSPDSSGLHPRVSSSGSLATTTEG